MQIQVATTKDSALFGYEAEVAPSQGETIKEPRAGREYIVVEVVHMLRERVVGLIPREWELQIVHCRVRKK